jgi:plasmid stabilization system protein ParE
MGYKVIFAPTAIARLGDIVRYIAADDPATAKTFGMHLIDRAQLLSEFPELGTAYRKRKNIRRLRCDPYFIYYRVRHDDHVIEVMDFWHSARSKPVF